MYTAKWDWKGCDGKSWGHGVAATTKISMKGTLCGPYLPPQKMSVNIKHLVTEPTTRQVILLQVKRKEWQHLTQLKMLPSHGETSNSNPNEGRGRGRGRGGGNLIHLLYRM